MTTSAEFAQWLSSVRNVGTSMANTLYNLRQDPKMSAADAKVIKEMIDAWDAIPQSPPPSSQSMGVTLTAETVIAMRDALIRNDVSEAYHQLYQAVDPTFCRYEPWVDTEAQLRPAPADHPVVGGQMRRIAELEAELEDARLEIEGARRRKVTVGNPSRERCERLEAAIRPINDEAAELVGLVPFFIEQAATWRGIAAAMGYEPLAHKEVRPKGQWLNERVAMFRAKVIEEGQPTPADNVRADAWIDVNERLPGEQGHDSEDVSVFLNGHCGLLDREKRNGGGWGYRTGFYDAAKQCFRVHGQLDRFVTHWQPLPAPPATATPETKP